MPEPVRIPERCDAELLCDLFDLPTHQREVILAGTASAHINAKLDLIRQFRVNAEGAAVLAARRIPAGHILVVGGQDFPRADETGRRSTIMEPVEAGGCAPPVLATLADALADQGRPE